MTDSPDRLALLDRYGRWYGEERFAIAFTSSVTGDDAKRVTTAGWDKTAPLATPDFGAALLTGRGLTRNPVVVLRPSNLIVLECDTEADLASIQALKLPSTITVRSSAPYKRHFYYRPPAELENLPYVAFRFESGKLTADSGRYFLCPPSIHPSGAVYSFLPGHGPGDTDIMEFPEYAYVGLSKRAREETAAQTEAIAVDPGAKVQAGQRGDRIFRYASMLRRWGLSRDAILDACLIWNDDRCDPPIEMKRVVMQVEGAMKMRGGQEIEYAVEHPKADLHVVHLDGDQPVYEEVEDDPEDDWRFVFLNDAAWAVPPEPPVVEGLLYRGLRHVVSGVTESGKTLGVYWLHLQALRLGFKVAVIDFEMGGFRSRNMLVDLGASEDEIGEIPFIFPNSPPSEGQLMKLVVHSVDFVVIDASVGAYDVSGLDDNHRKEVEQFGRMWINPLWKAGIATTMLDHLTKNVETQGKHVIGSERKVGQADVHLSFESRKALTRGGSGLVNVTVKKDRPGYLPRPTAAVFHFTSDPVDHAITIEKHDPPVVHTDEKGRERPDRKMEQISRFLEHPTHTPAEPEGFSTNEIEEALGGAKKLVKPALEMLAEADGHGPYITRVSGPRGSWLHSSLKPYRHEQDPVLHPELDDLPTSPRPPRDLPAGGGQSDFPSSPHPLQGGGEVRGGRDGGRGDENASTSPTQISLGEDGEMDEQDRAMLDRLREEAHRRAIDQDDG